MQKIKEFEDKVRQAFFFACRYGLYTYRQENSDKNKIDHHRFHVLCNTGFKIAQNIIFEELKLIQAKRRNLQAELKDARRKRVKQKEKLILEDIRFNEYKNDIFRLIIFSIVWQIFGGQLEYIIQFYIEDEGEKNLTDESFEAVVREAEKYNQEAEKFCLICDLTSNIQVGDLIIVSPNGYEIKEIKTGKKNEVALNLLEFYRHNAIELDEKRMSKSFDESLIDQLKRIKSQEERRKRVEEIIIKGKDQSKDTKTGKIDSFLITPSYYNQKYHDVLYEMIKKSGNGLN